MQSSPAETSISIPRPRTDLDNRVIAPDDVGYDAARALFYGGMDHRPAAIVRATDDEGPITVLFAVIDPRGGLRS